MDKNEDFLKELEQITNSLEKDYHQVIKPTENITNKISNNLEKKEQDKKEQNIFNPNPNKINVNQIKNNDLNDNPFSNFGMPFMNENINPEDCLKEFQKLMENDIDLDDNDPEAKEMMKLLGQNIKNLSSQFQELSKNENFKNSMNNNPFIPNSNDNSNQVNPNLDFNPNFFKDLNLNMFMNEDINKTSTPNKNSNEKQEAKSTNPFVDAYSEMNQTPFDSQNFMKFFSEMSGEGNNLDNMKDDNMSNILGLYEILSKLSDQKELDKNLSGEEKEKHLKSLFENLLEFLLKSDMLSEPLTQIKSSVVGHLDKNKGIMKPEEEEKYNSMLENIETINKELAKPEPNKPLIIDIFYKLHEMSNLDNSILDQLNPNFKDFPDLFGKMKNK